MAQVHVANELKDVQFYTALDPYYVTVDNRPLNDLDYNIRLVAAASDSSSGSAERAALGGASLAYSMLGFGGTNGTGVPGNDIYFTRNGMYSGAYSFVGTELHLDHGFAVIRTDGGTIDGRLYYLPAMAVHDGNSSKILGVNQSHLVQLKWRESTTSDRVGSEKSPVLVAMFDIKSTTLGNKPTLDSDAIAVLIIDITAAGAVTTTQLNVRDIEQTSNPLERAKINFNVVTVNLAAGLQNINLNGTGIDPAKIEAVEVFVQGVNQFNWTYNAINNQITLESPVTQNATVQVRQTNISLF